MRADPGETEPATAGPAVRCYQPADARAWEDLVGRSCNGTFLHTRRFLGYHGDRFRDRSLVLRDHRGRVTGVLPAAVSPACPDTIVSHPGLTYGGLVHDGSVRGAAMIAALRGITEHYRRLGYRRLRYKAVPVIYHTVPAHDDLYAMFRLGGRRYRSDLSATIDLSQRGRVSQRRIRSRRLAEAAGVPTLEGWDEIDAFWKILEANLAQRHDTAPVHSLEEIRLLHDLFPEQVILITGRAGGVLAGGAVLFAAGPVLHMQYTATTEQGREACVTDLVMERAIGLARHRGHRFFDFGVSTPDQGRRLDDGLYEFKVSFGAGGVVHEHYELSIPPGSR
jgi:Acetyltransferase (GNAT) domain